MKKLLKITFIGLIVLIFACKKDKSADTTTPLTFTSLVAKDSVFTVNATTELTATATGDRLKYTWSCEDGWGTFYGSGNKVSWTVCHASIFKIRCIVSDENKKSLSKEVYVRSQ
ncbi:MAG: hypothetical protein WC223_00105 [Bacteroidales bacterium]|jgi:hypothetical protein